jgi:hypothetical protein
MTYPFSLSTLFPFFRPWLAIMGGGVRARGTLQVRGNVQVRGPQHPDLPNPFHIGYVVRDAKTGRLEAVAYFGQQVSDPCYESPQGCPQLAVFAGLDFGQYFVSIEAHDDLFRQTGGVQGKTVLLSNFGMASSEPGRQAQFDPGQTTEVVIDATHKRSEILLNFPR